MPLFGAHMSVAGGYHRAAEAAARRGCDTVQLFTKNNTRWAGKPITPDQAAAFRAAVAAAGLRFPTAHDSYLINLASPDPALYRRSVDAMVDEVRRAESLGLDHLVTHPGSHVGDGEDAGLARVAAALDEVHRRCPDAHVRILLETTAGQGTGLGHRFEHLARVIGAVEVPDRLGVCFDTCHVFAAGYPLAPRPEYEATMAAFDRVVGLGRLRAFHVNDSVKPLGSRVDRHAHIGRGQVGLEAFRLLVTDGRFGDHPMILETPKTGPAGEDMDAVNLGVLRGFLAQAGPVGGGRSG